MTELLRNNLLETDSTVSPSLRVPRERDEAIYSEYGTTERLSRFLGSRAHAGSLSSGTSSLRSVPLSRISLGSGIPE